MSPLRGVRLLVATAALIAAIAIGEPGVLGLLGLCALVLFVVGAGSIAADAFPFRSRLALVCSILTPVAAAWLAMAGFADVPPIVAAAPAFVISLTPILAPRLSQKWV